MTRNILLALITACSLAIFACKPAATTKTNESSVGAQSSEQQTSGVVQTSAGAEQNIQQEAGAAAISVAQVVGVEKAAAPVGGSVGSQAANFRWKGSDGKEHSLAEYRGKTVLLNFWATWCPPCRRELPDIVRLHKSLDPAKVVILGVSMAEEAPAGVSVAEYVAEFAKRNELIYPLMLGTSELADAYGGVGAIPTTFIINAQGKITDQMVGGRGEDAFRKSLEAAM